MRSLALFVLLPNIASAETFTGEVIGVSNGDMITVLHNNKPVKISLYGVDCPEENQPYGLKAKRFTHEMVFGKKVIVAVVTKDRYGRTVARVTVDMERDKLTGWRRPGGLNDSLVASGLAWWHRKVAPKDRKLAKLQADAKKARRGLWADPRPEAPWTWRATMRRARLARAAQRVPKLPRSKDRVCKRDSDCTLHTSIVCDPCPKTNPAWRKPFSRKRLLELQKIWAVLDCKGYVCPSIDWIGNKAVCIKRQCTVRQVDGSKKAR